MASKLKSELAKRAEQAHVEARRTADRVLDRTALRPAQRAFEERSGEVVSGLARLFKGRSREPLGPQAQGTLVSWVGQRVHTLGSAVSQVLGRSTRDVLEAGYQATARILQVVRQVASPLDSVITSGRVVLYRHRELELMRQRSALALVDDLHGFLTDRLRDIPPQGATVGELISYTGELLDDSAWRVERLVRTETSYAYNLAQRDAIVALGREDQFSGVLQRWTERVDDFSGKPLDKRVGEDSLVLHGQVARPGGIFVMPSSDPRAGRMAGETWEHPPNRPNDRAVVTPWMRDWGVPAWMIQAGRRMAL